MNTKITKSKEQLINSFHQALDGFINSMNKSMEYAFQMGEILLELKEITPHGQFENVLKSDMRVVFGVRHAQRLMKISENRLLILEHKQDEPLSINEMLRIVSVHSKKIDPTLGQEGPEDAIEGEFTEIKPEPEPPDPQPVADSKQSTNHDEYTTEDHAKDLINDLTQENRELTEDNERMRLILQDTNETAAALREIEKLKSLNKGLQDRINALINENAALIRTVNSWERRYKKLQKELKEAGHE